MARAIPVPLRQVIWRRWQRGQTAADIADALALKPRTVRQLIRRWRQGHDAAPLAPGYDRCGWRRPWRDPEVFPQA